MKIRIIKSYGAGIQSSAGVGGVLEEIMPTLINGDNYGWQNGVAYEYEDIQEEPKGDEQDRLRNLGC